ncbi:hypothetical protein DSL72_007817 [Monilinia vaccinii-corymbosi]|uniref:Uncharacterized protein n=1 Tax=Monilinia vaccinii-corymbosi TaxID=61207 RepID=A0A8A3PIU1_9HELO|nr:hypothetical protein DSL72_007817 [Monilinia vaccinii-corymbosi]
MGNVAFKRADRGRGRVDSDGTAKAFVMLSTGNAGNRVAALEAEIHRVFSGDSRNGFAGVCLISSRAGNRNKGSGKSANRQNNRR